MKGGLWAQGLSVVRLHLLCEREGPAAGQAVSLFQVLGVCGAGVLRPIRLCSVLHCAWPQTCSGWQLLLNCLTYESSPSTLCSTDPSLTLPGAGACQSSWQYANVHLMGPVLSTPPKGLNTFLPLKILLSVLLVGQFLTLEVKVNFSGFVQA